LRRDGQGDREGGGPAPPARGRVRQRLHQLRAHGRGLPGGRLRGGLRPVRAGGGRPVHRGGGEGGAVAVPLTSGKRWARVFGPDVELCFCGWRAPEGARPLLEVLADMADEGVTGPAAEKPRLRDESLEALLGRAIGNVRRNRQYFVVGAVVLLVAMLNHPSVNRGLPVAAPAGVSTGAPAADASAAAPAATPASSADALAASAGTSQVAAAITPYSPPPDSSSVAGSPPSSGGDSPPPASSPPPQSAPPSYTCSSDSGMPAP